MLKAIGIKQTSEFGDGFLTTAGNYMRDPDVNYNLKKIWIIPLPKVESIAIYDGPRKIVGVKTSELDQVSDLFSPKEFGQLLAQAWLNGWDANDAKKLAEDFEKEYPYFGNIWFKGATLSCGVFDGGWVILDKEGVKHIIKRHILTRAYRSKDKFKYLSAQDIMREIKETIRNPDDVDCGKKPNSMLLVRYSPKLGTKWQ